MGCALQLEAVEAGDDSLNGLVDRPSVGQSDLQLAADRRIRVQRDNLDRDRVQDRDENEHRRTASAVGSEHDRDASLADIRAVRHREADHDVPLLVRRVVLSVDPRWFAEAVLRDHNLQAVPLPAQALDNEIEVHLRAGEDAEV